MKKPETIPVKSVVPHLVFVERAEEAIAFYVSLFPDSRVVDVVRHDGRVMHAAFELAGRTYTAFDGGPHFAFSTAFSLVATCDTQEQLDEVWQRLLADGGKEGVCGWLTDRFGVSWQVVPTTLGAMMSNPKGGNTQKAMEALLKMTKLDIAALEKAYRR